MVFIVLIELGLGGGDGLSLGIGFEIFVFGALFCGGLMLSVLEIGFYGIYLCN